MTSDMSFNKVEFQLDYFKKEILVILILIKINLGYTRISVPKNQYTDAENNLYQPLIIQIGLFPSMFIYLY